VTFPLQQINRQASEPKSSALFHPCRSVISKILASGLQLHKKSQQTPEKAQWNAQKCPFSCHIHRPLTIEDLGACCHPIAETDNNTPL